MAKFSNLRQVILDRLLEAFNSIRSAKVHRAALWILGEYCAGAADIQAVMNEVRQSLGEIPIVEDELRKAAGEEQVGGRGHGGLGMVLVLFLFCIWQVQVRGHNFYIDCCDANVLLRVCVS